MAPPRARAWQLSNARFPPLRPRANARRRAPEGQSDKEYANAAPKAYGRARERTGGHGRWGCFRRSCFLAKRHSKTRPGLSRDRDFRSHFGSSPAHFGSSPAQSPGRPLASGMAEATRVEGFAKRRRLQRHSTINDDEVNERAQVCSKQVVSASAHIDGAFLDGLAPEHVVEFESSSPSV